MNKNFHLLITALALTMEQFNSQGLHPPKAMNFESIVRTEKKHTMARVNRTSLLTHTHLFGMDRN